MTSTDGPERPRPSIFDRLAEPLADRAREKLNQAEDRVREAIQSEIDNVGASVRRRAVQVRPSAIAFGAAALLTFFGLALFVTAAVLGLAHAVPVWASALIIGGALVLVGAGLAAWGRHRLPKGAVGIAAVPVVPPVHPAGEQVHPWAD